MQVPAGDKALWAAQDSASEALPSALSRAFCGVQEQFFETSKARPCYVPLSMDGQCPVLCPGYVILWSIFTARRAQAHYFTNTADVMRAPTPTTITKACQDIQRPLS